MKKNIFAAVLMSLFILICSCAPLRKPLDKRSGFSESLAAMESYIRKSDWNNARAGLADVQKSWHEIKPFLQIDIDHDYVNDIESNIEKLKAYLESGEKADSLASVLLIKKSWEEIDQM